MIGANGAGKTRMSVWIDDNNPEIPVHRVSAQKSLNMPQIVSPTEIKVAEEEFLYGMSDDDEKWLVSYGKKNRRWGNAPETFLLNDYEKLMQYLVTEEYQKAIEYRKEHKEGDTTFDNTTRLEKIKEIWENVILHRKLRISAGKIEASSSDEGNYYNGCEMSDGERAVYMEALKIINDKGLLPYTALSNKFGWKKEYYIEYVLRILEIGDTTGQGLRTSIRRYIFDYGES